MGGNRAAMAQVCSPAVKGLQQVGNRTQCLTISVCGQSGGRIKTGVGVVRAVVEEGDMLVEFAIGVVLAITAVLERADSKDG